MTAALVLGNGIIGSLYILLGVVGVWEVISQYRSRGLSRFGMGVSAVGLTCGTHHLAVAWHMAKGGEVSIPQLVVMLLGLPPCLLFAWLRLESLSGGAGDRMITGRPYALAGIGMLFFAAIGWLVGQRQGPALTLCTPAGLSAASSGLLSPGALSNLAIAVVYMMVGWYLMETQVRRYATSQHWSLSGVSLALIFCSCSCMHLIHAISPGEHAATIAYDLGSVPASVYFLWAVKQVHRDSVVDWNRRPLVGVAARPERASPWTDSL